MGRRHSKISFPGKLKILQPNTENIKVGNTATFKCQPPIKLHTLGEESPEDWVFAQYFHF